MLRCNSRTTRVRLNTATCCKKHRLKQTNDHLSEPNEQEVAMDKQLQALEISIKLLIQQQNQTQQEFQQVLSQFRQLNSRAQELEQCETKVKEQAKRLMSLEQEIKDKFCDQEKELEERKKEVEELTALLQKSTTIGGGNQKIKLNVGGKLFVTSLATLTSEKDTYFSALFSEHFRPEPDEDGEIFIDRNPKQFHLILDHLRGEDISQSIAALSKEDKYQYEQQVDFYLIGSLIPEPVPVISEPQYESEDDELLGNLF